MFKAAVRVNKMKAVAQLRGATLHAHRHDEVGRLRVREGAVAGTGLAWSKAEDPRDYLAAFRAHKAELHAGERKGAPLALQVLCVVSPEWVQAKGGLHDPGNPRNRQLFEEARRWAEGWAGKGAVFASRLDLDEKGGAVVDLLVAPVRLSRGKPVISTQKALVELKAAAGERNEYAALQTSWAEWCATHLDQAIVRGTRREITAREHLSPETYGAVMDRARDSVRETSRTVMEVLKHADLSHGDAEALGDYLLLKGEVARHKALGAAYDPPGARPGPNDVAGMVRLRDERRGPWPVIEAIRARAVRLIDAATRFGLGWDAVEDADRRGYAAGREHFPRLDDRMHLSAVLAHCGAFCARIEATVKNLIRGHAHVQERTCWPEGAAQVLERHQRALGLVAPEVREATQVRETAQATRVRTPKAKVQAAVVEEVRAQEVKPRSTALEVVRDQLAKIAAAEQAREAKAAAHEASKPHRARKGDTATHDQEEHGHEQDRGHAHGDDDDAWGL